MAVAILGDLSLTKLVSTTSFKNQLNLDYAAYQVSSMATFQQYDQLLPSGVKYVVVGCLGPILVEQRVSQSENRELTLKRMMMSFSQGLTSILEARPEVRLIIMRPTLRSTPGTFKGDLVLLQPFLNSLDKGQIKMRVMPHFPMESTMLRVDGVSMTTAATASFLTFLASQISDLVSYFVSRNERSQGEVVLDENSNEPPLPVQLQVQSTPPPPPMGTPGSFGSWNFPDYTTPLADPPVPPVSGPCYQASAPRRGLLPETASLGQVVHALNNFYDDFLERCLRDNHDYANQMDVNDGEFNKQNASKVTVSGFVGVTYPDDLPSQRALFTPLLEPIVTQLLGVGTTFELHPRRGVVKNGTLPPVEVEFASQQLAIRFRTEGARLSRAKTQGMANLYFNSSLSLATRVRVEVLRALSNRVTNSQLLSYCVSNGPRPKLSVGPAVGFPGKRVSHFYVPAIKKYGHLLEDHYLEKAYARAQMFFTGELERTFLVLREKVAMARMEARKGPVPHQDQPLVLPDVPLPPPQVVVPPVEPSTSRGQKREASITFTSTPSKKR